MRNAHRDKSDGVEVCPVIANQTKNKEEYEDGRPQSGEDQGGTNKIEELVILDVL